VAKTLPKNQDVAEQLELLADLLELDGEPSFRVIAYRRAATRIRETPGAVAQMALDGTAKDLPGIGKTIEEKIVQIVDDGEINALTKRKALVPAEVVSFMRLPGLGPKSAARIWKQLGITTVADLKKAAEAEQLRTLSGFGARTEERILHALSQETTLEPIRPLLGAGLAPVLEVVRVLREHAAADLVSEAGSVRRRKETFRDLDIIATAQDPRALTDYFVGLGWVSEIAAHGDTKATVVSHDGLRFDLRVVPPESFGNLLQHFTGSKDHNVALREHAVKRGLSISEYGVKNVESGEVFTTRDEAELYEFLGYQFIPAELRENLGEIDAARKGELPELVDVPQVRGDMHLHSTWSSDGKNTVEEMARKCIERGYQYMVITDHSHYLRGERLVAQWREIDQVNEKVAPFRILRGIEANIRATGEVDVDEEMLAQLDWVVASLHQAFDKSPTERIMSAMEHPYVHCIGHPTARKINKRGPADVDIERVIEKALETKTFLEINSQPDRLDLRDVNARRAGEAGLKLPVNTDAHEVGALDWMDIGIAQARRAWLTKDHVLNTRTWKQIERLKKKG
jgi:DNA polymerase (family 10)